MNDTKSGIRHPKYIWAALAGTAWQLVALGAPWFTCMAVIASFAALDHILSGKS